MMTAHEKHPIHFLYTTYSIYIVSYPLHKRPVMPAVSLIEFQ
jgi:hypothetical protein